VHTARKRLKSARATLRLLRALIGDRAYRQANLTLRDVSAPLGAARDAAALLQRLEPRHAHRSGIASAARALRRELERERLAARRDLRPRGSARRAGLARLARVERQARRWPPGELSALAAGPPALLRGLTASYRHGQRGYRAVRRRASDAALHEWRKQSKYLAGELRLLRTLPPRRVEPPRRRAARLADLLGTDHDLALLRGRLQRCRSALPARSASLAASALRLRERIDRQRARLQARALASGERLYRLTPVQFTARLQQA
jgi:hypothetical protein